MVRRHQHGIYLTLLSLTYPVHLLRPITIDTETTIDRSNLSSTNLLLHERLDPSEQFAHEFLISQPNDIMRQDTGLIHG